MPGKAAPIEVVKTWGARAEHPRPRRARTAFEALATHTVARMKKPHKWVKPPTRWAPTRPPRWSGSSSHRTAGPERRCFARAASPGIVRLAVSPLILIPAASLVALLDAVRCRRHRAAGATSSGTSPTRCTGSLRNSRSGLRPRHDDLAHLAAERPPLPSRISPSMSWVMSWGRSRAGRMSSR